MRHVRSKGTLVARHFVEGGGVREGAGALIKRAFAKKSDDNLTVTNFARIPLPARAHTRMHAHIRAHGGGEGAER